MSVPKILKVVILGAPGCGKGTIATRIVKDFNLYHISSGDLLRAEILQKSSIGVQAKTFIDKGQLVPDDLIIGLVKKQVAVIKQSWLLDGFPRTRIQSESLQKVEPLNLAINLDVPPEVIVDRIKGRWVHLASGRTYHTEFNPPKKPGVDDITGEALQQRDDDKPEVVLKRLQTYSQNVNPVLEFYRNLGILKEFSGKESNVIWPKVREFLNNVIPAKSG